MAYDLFGFLFWSTLGLGLLVALFWGPYALLRRYRVKYREGAGFRFAWRERSDEQDPFRGSEQEFYAEFPVPSRAEAAATVGFFLGILGFLWTPIVLIGTFAGFKPLIFVGLPGLVVSWSCFFSARAFLKHGPASIPLVRFTVVAEVLMNVAVLALVALCTAYSGMAYDDPTRDWIKRFLLVSSSDLGGYEIAYSMKNAGFLTVLYTLVSFAHAFLFAQTLRPMERLREAQARARMQAALAPLQNVQPMASWPMSSGPRWLMQTICLVLSVSPQTKRSLALASGPGTRSARSWANT